MLRASDQTGSETRTMQNLRGAQKLAAVMLAWLLSIQASLADPLHKFGNDGAYRHEHSGWIYPRRIGGLELVGAPYTIDGNNDVGAEYARVVDGMRSTAVVDVYFADSAAIGAQLATAKAAMQTNAMAGGVAELQSEGRFVVDQPPELVGAKASYTSRVGTDGSQSVLYFFQTAAWVVTIRTTAQATDTQAGAALDEFVRALRWDTLGTDPGNLHGAAK